MRYDDCGLVAQEVEAAIGGKYVDRVDQGNGNYNYQMKTYEFIPLIVKAIQELNAKLTETTARQANEIAVLRYEINQLKGELPC